MDPEVVVQRLVYIYIYFSVSRKARVTPLTTGQRSVFGGERERRVSHWVIFQDVPDGLWKACPSPPPISRGVLDPQDASPESVGRRSLPSSPQRESSGGYEHEECVSSDPPVESLSSGCDPRVRSRGHHAPPTSPGLYRGIPTLTAEVHKDEGSPLYTCSQVLERIVTLVEGGYKGEDPEICARNCVTCGILRLAPGHHKGHDPQVRIS